jgi:signal-transduction protein with cAMP-binding, CBS, and nucleotidyltransferase domain
MDKKVRDIMTANPVGVRAEQTIGDAARVMRDAGVGAVLVVAGDSLRGVVTDRDLVIRGLAEGLDADSAVGPLCSAEVIGVDADADISQAQWLMRENAIRRLPVIDAGQITGIVSLGDIAVSTDSESLLAAVSRARAST